jgi:hypothetical protein
MFSTAAALHKESVAGEVGAGNLSCTGSATLVAHADDFAARFFALAVLRVSQQATEREEYQPQ